MSFLHRLDRDRRVLIAATVVTVLASPVLAATLSAQGGMGGGGMGGGFGSPGGMGGRGHRGFGQSNSSAPNVSKHFEDLASLKDALKHVDGLNKDQKSGFEDIEHSYQPRFKSMGHDAQQIVDSAHTAHERPDHQRLDSLRLQAKRLRDEELGAARALLSTSPQRDRFDSNVAQIRADEAKHEEEMEERLGPGGRGGPGGPPGGGPGGPPGSL